MKRLTEKDELGNWCLKGVRWEQLRAGQVITKDVSERLIHINHALAIEVRKVLDENKAERHIRGGMATKLKYSHEKDIAG